MCAELNSTGKLGEFFVRLVPDAWKKESDKILVHYYSCGIAIENLLSLGYFKVSTPQDSGTDKNNNVLLFLAGIEGQETLYSIAFNVAIKNSIGHFIRSYRDKLPDSNYVLAVSLIAPGAEGEVNAEHNIEKAVGLLGVCLGRGVLLDFVNKIIVDLKTGRVSFPSRVLHVPKQFDSIMFDAAKEANELRKRSRHLARTDTDRMDLAFTYVCRALGEQNTSLRFLLYWTALEVITSGRPEGFVDRLARHYETNVEALAELRSELRAGEYIDSRVALIHHGKNCKLSSFGERLLQAVIADLAFAICNIKSRYALDIASDKLAEPLFDELRIGEVAMNLDAIAANTTRKKS